MSEQQDPKAGVKHKIQEFAKSKKPTMYCKIYIQKDKEGSTGHQETLNSRDESITIRTSEKYELKKQFVLS